MDSKYLSSIVSMAKPSFKPNNKSADKTMNAAQDFAQLMLKQMLEEGLKTNADNELFGGGQAEKIFNDMLTDEYAKMMADPKSKVGLTEMVYKELLKRSGKGGGND